MRAASSVYETEPMHVKDQAWFANMAAACEVGASWTPEGLLAALKAIEAEMGREQGGGERFGPRVIDIDIFLYGDVRRDSAELTLPHPRLVERAFALVPLAEIAPRLRLPGDETLTDALKRLEYRQNGRRIHQE